MDPQQLGWNDFFAAQCSSQNVGRVALAHRERFLVWGAGGENEVTVSGALRYRSTEWPVVGDWVTLRNGCVVDGVLNRRTKLSRKAPGTETVEQVLAANLDVLFIVSGLDRDYNPRRLERYLVLAEASGARPVVILNKADQRDDVAAVVRETKRISPDCPVMACSALEGWGLEDVVSFLAPAETAALIGSSGAGKSTILNALLGSERQATMEVRAADSRGRHTTTRREMVLMPEGWLLIDLPGLRELQLWADPEQIDQSFDDIAELGAACRFRDCRHEEEPGCAVRAAGMDEERLRNFQKMKREVAYLERQTNPHLARETKQRWKAIHRAMRHNPKR